MAISKEYLKKCAANGIVLEVEAGVVGGEEDGAAGTEDTPHDKLYTTPETWSPSTRRSLPRPLHLRRHLRQRPRPLQAWCRETEARNPQAGPGRRHRQVRRRGRVRPRFPRRIRFAPRGDPRDPRLRGGEDERRHRHAVCLHPPDRGLHVQELRRRPQGRREIGTTKKAYDPRAYLKAAEQGMAARIAVACDDLLTSSPASPSPDRSDPGGPLSPFSENPGSSVEPGFFLP